MNNQDVQQNITDHESILLLRQDVKNLKEGQDEFHKEMKESFVDLKQNYVSRIEHIEIVRIQVDHENRTRNLEEVTSDLPLIKKIVYGTAGLVLISVGTAIIYLVVAK